MKYSSSKLIRNLLLLALFSYGTILFFINVNIPLNADDYLYSFKFNKDFVSNSPSPVYSKIHSASDYIHSLSTLYQNLTGRITAHGLLQIMMLFPPVVFDFVNTCMVFLLCFLIVKLVVRSDNKYFQYYLLLTFSFYYLAGSRTYNNVFIAAFSCNYIWTQVIVLLFLLPFKEHYIDDMDFNHLRLFPVVMFILGIITGDTNEPVVPAVLLLIGILFVCKKIGKKEIPIWVYTAIIGLLIGFFFLYFAPGNSHRLDYENRHLRGSGNISIHWQNIIQVVNLSLSSIPALIIAALASSKIRFKKNKSILFTLIAPIILILGISFSLLFLPFITNRFNYLLIPYFIIFTLYMIDKSDIKNKQIVLLAVILLLSPFLIGKLASDYKWSNLAFFENELFKSELKNRNSDEVLVNPRATIEPISRDYWNVPIATYYGVQKITLRNVLSSAYYSQSHSVTYNVCAKTKHKHSNELFRLTQIRYNNISYLSRVMYFDFEYDSHKQETKPNISLYSITFRSQMIEQLYNFLPEFLRIYLMSESGEYRDIPFQFIDNGIRFAIPIQAHSNESDYFRIRLQTTKNVYNYYLDGIKYK